MARFAQPDPPHGYPQDVDMALEIDKYDFAIRIVRQDNLLVARRHE